MEKSGKVKSQRKCRVNQVKSRREPFLTVGKHKKRVRLWENTNGTLLLDLLSVREWKNLKLYK